MSDIKIFRLATSAATELKSRSVALEKSLQTSIEKNLFTFLGVKFLASEYSTGKTHGGRIDTAAVSLYYSRERDMIAIEPADPRRRESFPFRQTGLGWRISGAAFTGHYRIAPKHTIRFVRPDLTDSGALLLDLRNTVNVTERRSKRKGK